MPYKKINVGRLQKEEWFVTKYDLRLPKGNTYGNKWVDDKMAICVVPNHTFLFSLYHLEK